ncbi:MAG TPA: 50S ribosomal protein L14e [archaeon]|nr:50S ribosomal protein L14e [archaeon]
MIDVGRVCIKKKGREAGMKAVIVELKEGFAVVDGPSIKRKKCNVRHLFPTPEKFSIKSGASHEEVLKHFK